MGVTTIAFPKGGTLMHLTRHLAVLASTVLGTAVALAAPAAASPQSPAPGSSVVFAQTDELVANHVVAYDRDASGGLTPAGSFATGGAGGRLAGAVVDFTASQGALTADRDAGLLYAVNAGSNTISVFDVSGDNLHLAQVIGSGGTFPVSITTHGNQVYVLNARDGGTIQGYLRRGDHLESVPSWHRALGLDPTATPEFTHTPGQVAFTPNGRHLIVTTKAASNSILVYAIDQGNDLAASPVVRGETGTVPFAVAFDARSHLQVADAGTNAVSTYDVARDGALTPLGSTPTGQRATCWIASSGDLLAASNAGSATVSTLLATAAGAPTLVTATAAGPGTVDASFTPDGRYLYVQGGGTGRIDAFGVNSDATLTALGAVPVPNAAGGEGIVAW